MPELKCSLYPLNEGTHVVSKALLPIGNVPIINLVLDWVIASGLTGECPNSLDTLSKLAITRPNQVDILLIVPPAYYSAISNHLNENFTAHSHPRARIELKRHTDGEKDEDDEEGSGVGASGSGDGGGGSGNGVGTARLLRRFRHSIKVSDILRNFGYTEEPRRGLTVLLVGLRTTTMRHVPALYFISRVYTG